MADQSCPLCTLDDLLEHSNKIECLTCGHEWVKVPAEEAEENDDNIRELKDAYGNILKDGDIIAMIKDKKLKGSSEVLKSGMKSKPIRIVESGDHQISCKMNGISVMLKSQFVKKIK